MTLIKWGTTLDQLKLKQYDIFSKPGSIKLKDDGSNCIQWKEQLDNHCIVSNMITYGSTPEEYHEVRSVFPEKNWSMWSAPNGESGSIIRWTSSRCKRNRKTKRSMFAHSPVGKFWREIVKAIISKHFVSWAPRFLSSESSCWTRPKLHKFEIRSRVIFFVKIVNRVLVF